MTALRPALPFQHGKAGPRTHWFASGINRQMPSASERLDSHKQLLGCLRETNYETGSFAIFALRGVQCARKLLGEGVDYPHPQAHAVSLRVEAIDQANPFVTDDELVDVTRRSEFDVDLARPMFRRVGHKFISDQANCLDRRGRYHVFITRDDNFPVQDRREISAKPL